MTKHPHHIKGPSLHPPPPEFREEGCHTHYTPPPPPPPPPTHTPAPVSHTKINNEIRARSCTQLRMRGVTPTATFDPTPLACTSHRGTMVQQQSHLQQVVNTTNLLVRAIDRLQQSSGESASTSGPSSTRVSASLPGPSPQVPNSAGSSHHPTTSASSYQTSQVSSELSSLFGWGRKRSLARRIPPGSKKKRSYKLGPTRFIV